MENQPLDHSTEHASGAAPETDIYFDKPGLILRIKSMLIDSVVLIALMLLISLVLNGLGIESGIIRGVFLVAVWLYEPLFTSINRTLGQTIMGLQVSRLADLQNGVELRPISFPASIIRFIVKVFLGWLSLLTIHSSRYGQAIHDKAADSVMILTER